ncbi:MAG: hypothetical protein GC178_15280 [Flavobacteriales bacterium]|nr:hypothetical protein [Flavobacteriales bacterium]
MKKNHKGLYGVFLISMVLLSSCYYDNEEQVYEYYNQNNTCDTSAVTFANDIMPMIQGNCVSGGCHMAGGTGNGIFENYSEVKAKVDNGSMMQRVVVAQDMPPGGGLTSCQISQMQAWILNGAPNN